jgi:hypothetical protein
MIDRTTLKVYKGGSAQCPKLSVKTKQQDKEGIFKFIFLYKAHDVVVFLYLRLSLGCIQRFGTKKNNFFDNNQKICTESKEIIQIY